MRTILLIALLLICGFSISAQRKAVPPRSKPSQSPSPSPTPSAKQIRRLKEVDEAIAALKRVRTAADKSYQFQSYEDRVLDAKAAVDEAMDKLEDHFPELALKVELSTSITHYSIARSVWKAMLPRGYLDLERDSILTDSVLKVFPSIPVHETQGRRVIYDFEALEVIWKSAGSHLSKALEMYTGEKKLESLLRMHIPISAAARIDIC